jgi:hypothetical protein
MNVGKGFQKAPVMTPRKSQKSNCIKHLSVSILGVTVRRNFTLGHIDPHAMQEDGELTGNGDTRGIVAT